MTRALGKLAPKVDPRTLRLARYATAAWQPPATADWAIGVPMWGELGNDSVGCCTCSAAGHAIQEWTDDALGAEANVTTAEVLAAYSAVTGYDPADPSTDQGAVCLDVLNFWRKTGVAGHKIGAYAAVDVHNEAEVRAAVDLFGCVYIGIALPMSAETELNQGKPWASTSGTPGGWGGHCVIIVAYDDTYLTCITWGARQRMTWEFWIKYVDEAYALLSPDWLGPKGAPNGFDLAALQADLAAVTSGSPLVGPTPAPAPPAPDPGAASFHVSAPVAARVVALAARAHLTPDAWVERRLREYLRLPKE